MKVAVSIPLPSEEGPCSPEVRPPHSCSSRECSEVSEQEETSMSCESSRHSVSSWARCLAANKYFVPCSEHAHMKRNECTFFCVTCGGTEALCHHCLDDHEDHHVIQVRRYVYEDVVNTADMKDLINMEGIQTYTINQAPVIFVKDRPPTGTVRNNHKNGCTVCNRCLKPEYSFCSIACKVNAAKAQGNPEMLQPVPGSASCKQRLAQRRKVVRNTQGSRSRNYRRSSSLEDETISLKLNRTELLREAFFSKKSGSAIHDAGDSSFQGSCLKRKAAFTTHPSRRKQLSPRRSPSL